MRRVLIWSLACAVLLAACGGDDGPTGVASLEDSTDTTLASEGEAGGEVDLEEAVLAFTQCLRDEGLDVVDPGFDADGGFVFEFREEFRSEAGPGPNDEFRAAMDACQEHMEGVAQQFERSDESEIQDDLLAFAECMRDNGIDIPDPDFSEAFPGGSLLFELDISDPETEAALEACQDELAFGGPGGGFGGGPGRGGGDS